MHKVELKISSLNIVDSVGILINLLNVYFGFIGFPLSDAIQHAPCVDTCSKRADREKEDQRVRQIGLRLKQQYIARAQGHIKDTVSITMPFLFL